VSELANNARDAHSLWRDNPVLVHLLGLTPVLALSTTLLQGAALLSIMTILLLTSSMISGLTQPRINATWRFVFDLLILALLATLVSSGMSSWLPALHEALGVYLPLLGCSMLPLLHLQTTPAEAKIAPRLTSLGRLLGGYALAIVPLSALREGLTHGRLLTDLSRVIPGLGRSEPEASAATSLLPFAATPAAGFLLLGLLCAAATWLRRFGSGNPAQTDITPAPRARVTEKLQSIQ